MVLGPLIKEGLSRLGDHAFALLLAEVLRAAMICLIIWAIAPWDSAIEKVQRTQVRDRIVKNERTRQIINCDAAKPDSDNFETCYRLQLDIEIDREKLRQKSTVAPLSKARAALQ